MVALYRHAMRRVLELPADEVYVPNPADARFANPIGTESAPWDILEGGVSDGQQLDAKADA